MFAVEIENGLILKSNIYPCIPGSGDRSTPHNQM